MVDLAFYKNKNIHIVGFLGIEGYAVLEFLLDHGITNFTVHDFIEEEKAKRAFRKYHIFWSLKKCNEKLDRILNSGIKVYFKKSYLKDAENADIIFVSQAWYKYPQNKKLFNLREKGIEFDNMTNTYLRLAPCPVVAVTGSLGKTTTARMICSILDNSEKKYYFAGNDNHRPQILDKLDEMKKDNLLVVEVSNRQLKMTKKSPHIGIVTNIFPNHLDEHRDLADYIETKKNLLRYQGNNDFAILNSDDENVSKWKDEVESQIKWFSLENKADTYLEKDWLMLNKERLIKKSDLKVSGDHNIANALAASLACDVAGISLGMIKKGLKEFSGVLMRISLITEKNGVRYYNDLRSTTPSSTKVALESFSSPIILVCGGGAKNLDYKNLAEVICQKVKLLILLESDVSREIKKSLEKSNCKRLVMVEIKSAKRTSPLIKEAQKKGDIVLFSPAGDYFVRDFLEKEKINLKKIIKEI